MGDKASGCVIFKKAGHKVPEAYLDLVIKKNPDFWGMSYNDNGSLKMYQGPNEANNLEKMVESVNGIVDENDALIHVGKAQSGKFDRMNIQPFIVFSDKSKTILVSCVEGDFSAFAKQGSPLSEEYWANAQFAGRWFGPVYRQFDENVNEFLKWLDTPDARTVINRLCDERGLITFFSNTGKVLKFFKGNDDACHAEFPWGWVSQNYGYVEKDNVVPLSKNITDKAKKIISSSLSSTAKIVENSDGTKEVVTPTTVTNEQIREAVKETSDHYLVSKRETNADGTITEYRVPPKTLTSNNELRDWYLKYGKDANGAIPNKNARKSRTPVKVTLPGEPGNTGPVSKLSERPVHNHNHSTEEDFSKENAVVLQQFRDRSMKKTLNPSELLKQVEERTPFHKILGLAKIEDVCNWPHDLYVEVCDKYPEESARLIEDLIVELSIAQRDADEREAAAREEKTVTVEKKTKEKKEEARVVHEEVTQPVVTADKSDRMRKLASI